MSRRLFCAWALGVIVTPIAAGCGGNDTTKKKKDTGTGTGAGTGTGTKKDDLKNP